MTGLRIYPVTGPPGAGKTTALSSIGERHPGFARFAVREYGLSLAEAGHPLGLLMRDSLLGGVLLPDHVVRQEFALYLGELPGHVDTVAVEGYPRDLAQCADLADVVAAAGVCLAGLIVVDIPDEVVRARVAARRICVRCGHSVAVDAAAWCPRCGGPLARRADDATERLDRRLHDFRTVSAQVRSYFARSQRLHVVDGLRGPDEVCDSLTALLWLAGDRPATAAGARRGDG